MERMTRKQGVLMLVAGLLSVSSVHAAPWKGLAYSPCLLETAKRYSVNPALIAGIIETESNFKPDAIRNNRNGTEDVGLMQINSEWLPRISQLGYNRKALFNPCTNILVGTWILAQEIKRFGYTWKAVGAYHTGATSKNETRRLDYAQRVYCHIVD